MWTKIFPHFEEKIWGGHKLSQSHPSHPPQGTGESFEISTLTGFESRDSKTVPLGQLLGRKLGYVLKIIDTKDALSVQVHPNNAWGKILENSPGKDECWLVLKVQPGSGVYLGFRPHIGATEFEQAMKENNDLSKLLNFYEVREGDFFKVQAGMIHAIGAGVTLLEVQQASGITYRIWDWNRLEDNGLPRQLHQEKAIKVLNFDPRVNQQGLVANIQASKKSSPLWYHEDFTSHYFHGKKGEVLNMRKEFFSLTLLTGELRTDQKKVFPWETWIWHSSNDGEARIVFQEDSSFVVASDIQGEFQ